MALTYRTDGPWGAGKGSVLTKVEFDQNTYTLKTAIDGIIADPPEAVSIDSFIVEGSLMTIVMTDASEHGPFVLPTAQWRFVGEWQAGVTMFVGDIFTNDSSLYFTRVQHVAAATFDPDLFTEDGAVYILILPKTTFPYGLNFYWHDLVEEGDDILWQHVADRAYTIPADFADSQAYLRVACSENAITIPIYLGGAVIGDIVFTPGVDTDLQGGQYGVIAGIDPSVSFDVAIREVLAVGQPYNADISAKGLSVSFNLSVEANVT